METGIRVRIAYLAEPTDLSAVEPGLELVSDLGLPLNLFRDFSQAIEWLTEFNSTSD